MDNEGFWSVKDVAPMKGHLKWLSADPECYALRLQGDALEPLCRSGDFVIVRPSAPCEPDRPVYIVMIDGRATVRDLARISDTEIVLRGPAGGARMTISRDQVAIMHRVTGYAADVDFVEE